jgi:hypothetical protein
MKKFVLAAFAALGLSLSVGSAFAQPVIQYSHQPQVTHWGPAYGSDSSVVD